MKQTRHAIREIGCSIVAFLSIVASTAPIAQQPPSSGQASSTADDLRTRTAADHEQMKEQLNIKALRPGPSGNEQAPNHANYDEALANPFPTLPDPLTFKDGRKDLGTNEDYRTAKMPAVNTGLLDGRLAWRQHDGGHTDGPNWKYFIAWADKFIGRVPPARSSSVSGP